MKLLIRIVFAAIAAVPWLALASTAQTPQATPFSADMQIKYELGDTPQQWHGKLFVDGGHMRFDLHNPPHETPSVLTNFATQTNDVLFPQMKAYLEHPVGDPHAVGPSLAMRDLRFYEPGNPCGNQAGLSCRKIGVETVANRSCDHWEVSRKDTAVNLWIDQKLHFPLKTVTDTATVTLTNLKEGAQNAALFQLPSDYKKMNMHPPPGTTSSQPKP